ncbi:MAG: TonB family protein [Bacteroidota bacterium]
MSTKESTASSPVAAHLAEAHSRLMGGNYASALIALKEAKALEPKNVYILAFEKQAEQLGALEATHSLTDESRGDIMDSIPGIIEKAVELSRTSAGVTVVTGIGKPAADLHAERQERAAALEWLKNQYFQHAHDYVRKGEYQHALAEIRRVYIIDPANKIARDFEKQIDQLAQLKTQHSTKTHPAILPSLPETQPPVIAPTLPPSAPGTPEPTPTMTEEWSSPQRLSRRGERAAAAPAAKKKGNGLLIALIIIASIVLVLVGYWYYQRNIAPRRSPDSRSLSPPSAEMFIGAPTETAEQSFVVTQSEADSAAGPPEVTQLEGETSSSGSPSREDAAERPPPGVGRSQQTALTENATRQQPGEQRRSEGSAPLQATTTEPTSQPPPSSESKSADTASPLPFVAVEKEAKIIRLEKPRFSSLAFEQGIEGQVIVQVRIDASGKPLQTLTLRSTNDLLTQPVIEAVMRSEFSPAEMSTGPVASWLTIPFKFSAK